MTQTKYAVACDSGIAVLITDIPLDINMDDLMHIAYMERRFIEMQSYESYIQLHPEESVYFDDYSLAMPMPELYVENPLLVPNEDEYEKLKDSYPNAIWLGGVQSIVSYKHWKEGGELVNGFEEVE